MSHEERPLLNAPDIPAATRGPSAKCIVVVGGFPKCRCTRLIPCTRHATGATGGAIMDRYYPQFEQGVISPFPMKKAAIEDERRLEWDPAHFAAFQARPQENRVRCDDCQNYMLNELCVRNGANGGAEYGEGHPRYAPNRSRITVTEHEPNEPYDVCDFVMTICPRCHRIESDLFLCGEHRTEANFMAACRLDWKLIGPAHPSPISAQEMDYTMKRHIYVDKVPDYCDHCRPSGE